MPLSRSRSIRILGALGAFLTLYVAGVLVRSRYGIEVFARNESRETLRDVSLKVESRGARYVLPDLANGKTRRVFVHAVGESSIVLEFSDEHGQRHREMVAGYVEDGYCGVDTITVWPGGAVETHEDNYRMVCWRSWLEFLR
jgi:hypothetical protein